MKCAKNWMARCFVLAVVVLLTAIVSSPARADRADELAKLVKIRRTDYGVPHIEAPTLEAVAFGFGYAQAEDHLLNIMHSMLRARGDVHRLRQGTLDLPVSGGSGFLGWYRVLGFRTDPDDRQVVNGGDSWIFAVEFGEVPKAYTVVGYSQSEDPKSPHFNDQAKLFAAGKMKPAAFSEQEIDAALVRSYTPADDVKP